MAAKGEHSNQAGCSEHKIKVLWNVVGDLELRLEAKFDAFMLEIAKLCNKRRNEKQGRRSHERDITLTPPPQHHNHRPQNRWIH